MDALSDDAKALLFVARAMDDFIKWGYLEGKLSLTPAGTSVGDQLLDAPQISFDDFVQILKSLGIALNPTEHQAVWTLYKGYVAKRLPETLYKGYVAKRIPEQQCTDNSETD